MRVRHPEPFGFAQDKLREGLIPTFEITIVRNGRLFTTDTSQLKHEIPHLPAADSELQFRRINLYTRLVNLTKARKIPLW